MSYNTKTSEFENLLTEATNASFDCGDYEFRAKEDPAETYELIREKFAAAKEKVINLYAELERENARLKNQILKMREAGESMRCGLEEYQSNYGYSYEDDPCDKWESALSALPNVV
jgi:hypothetical protein